MKDFLTYLTEAKDRFIKKNRNLSKDQQEEIIKFFKTNRQAESKVDWQKAHKMNYDDFTEIMLQFKSGRKSSKGKKVKCADNLRGLKKNEDYVHLRIKSNEYCAYIPLNFETAQEFNKNKVIGTCGGPWCVGHSFDKSEWGNHVLNQGEVPVYVVGNDSKWIVMVQSNNNRVDIWDVNNTIVREIPGLDVKKVFLDSKKKKLYDDIRNDFYAHDEYENPDDYNVPIEAELHEEIAAFEARNCTVDVTDMTSPATSGGTWLVEHMNDKIIGCSIQVTDDDVYINDGRMEEVQLGLYSNADIFIGNCSLFDCEVSKTKEIEKCTFRRCKISDTEMFYSNISDSEVEDCYLWYMRRINSSDIKDTEINDFDYVQGCECTKVDFKGGHVNYKNIIRSSDIEGGEIRKILIRDSELFDNVTIVESVVEKSKVFSCDCLRTMFEKCVMDDSDVNSGTWNGGFCNNSRLSDVIWDTGEFDGGKKGYFAGSKAIAIWTNGVFRSGDFEHAKWFDGKWLGGNWIGGFDSHDVYHKEGDAPFTNWGY